MSCNKKKKWDRREAECMIFIMPLTWIRKGPGWMPGPFSGLLFYCAAKHHSPAEKQPPLIDPDLSQHEACGIKRMKMHLQKTPSVEFYRAVSLSRPAFAPASSTQMLPSPASAASRMRRFICTALFCGLLTYRSCWIHRPGDLLFDNRLRRCKPWRTADAEIHRYA